MKQFFTIMLLIIARAGFAQQKITPEEASKHIGDSLTVCGKIYSGVYLERTTSKLTLLNVGGAYPNAPFTVVIPPALRAVLQNNPEINYQNKSGCFTGTIVLFKDKPQVVLNNPQQMQVPVEAKDAPIPTRE
jgi:hypothetical protein